MQQAQELAQQAGFLGALAKGHHLAGNFLQALECALHSPSGQPAAPPPPWDCTHSSYTSPTAYWLCPCLSNHIPRPPAQDWVMLLACMLVCHGLAR